VANVRFALAENIGRNEFGELSLVAFSAQMPMIPPQEGWRPGRISPIGMLGSVYHSWETIQDANRHVQLIALSGCRASQW
jgi:hypothetical protein